ncbi:MAG: fibronectin type III domain-containing protein, partial [Firmicutes bacterium]|nr:fibronectin type III domain-containing protein [Bacillota bacterium]
EEIGYRICPACENLRRIDLSSVRSIEGYALEGVTADVYYTAPEGAAPEDYAGLINQDYGGHLNWIIVDCAHEWEETRTTDAEPTCSKHGRTSIHCRICGMGKDVEVIPALGHILHHVEAKAPTYEEEGNIEHWVCERCGGFFTDEAARWQVVNVTMPKLQPPEDDPTDPTDPTGDDPTDPTDPSIQDPAQPVPQTIRGHGKYNKTVGQTFRLDARAKTALSYRSSNKKVAVVDKRGRVTIKGCGTCKITVTAAATDAYKKAVRKITIIGKLARPVLRAVNLSGQRIKLSWNKASGADGYLLYVRLPGENKYRLAVSRSARVKSVTHRGLAQGKTYRYKLRTYAKAGPKTVYSKYSKPVTVKVRR